MKETLKANNRRKDDTLFQNIFKGKLLDIGPGDDPFNPDTFPAVSEVICVDQFPPHAWRGEQLSPKVKRMQGNAENMAGMFPDESFDVVHSSQCLEHMVNPHGALCQWWKFVKPGGHMVITVPDEELYEKCKWPPQFNTDHKFTFRVPPKQTEGGVWIPEGGGCTPVSIFLPSLMQSLWRCRILKCDRVDTNYDYEADPLIDQTLGEAEAFLEAVCEKAA